MDIENCGSSRVDHIEERIVGWQIEIRQMSRENYDFFSKMKNSMRTIQLH